MTLISFSALQDGVTGVNAAATNTPLNTIYNDYNGNVTDANISASAAIAFSKVAGGSSTALVASQSWTPSWTNVSIGNASVTAKYTQVGKWVWCRMVVVWGTTTSASNTIIFSLPVTSVAYPGTQSLSQIGVGVGYDVSANGVYAARIQWASTTTAQFSVENASATYLTLASMTNTVPTTWANTDEWHCEFFYEAA